MREKLLRYTTTAIAAHQASKQKSQYLALLGLLSALSGIDDLASNLMLVVRRENQAKGVQGELLPLGGGNTNEA